MELFLAKQPIFDKNNNVVAYELLFRNGNVNEYKNMDGDYATRNVITNAFYSMDIKNITEEKKVFINFTENLIKDEVATLIPSNRVVIEILEDIEPSDRVTE